MKELRVLAEIQNIERVNGFVDEQLEPYELSPKAAAQLHIAVDELFGNIARYAYAPGVGSAVIRMEIEEEPLAVNLVFIDRGVPYDPLAKEDPDVTLPANERPLGGLGIYMVKKCMDAFSYEYKDGYNCVRIKKYLTERGKTA